MIEIVKHEFGVEGAGHQKKAWVTNGGQKYLIKINSKYREALKEQDASIILRACGINAVEYKAIKVIMYGSERNACICKSFLNDGEFTVTLGKILEDISISSTESAKSYFEKSVRAVSTELGLEREVIYKYIITLLTTDYLLMNPDRHLSNIEFICGETGWRVSPFFDYGQSFLHRDGIGSIKQFRSEERFFKTLPFSRNPEKNLIDLEYSQYITKQMVDRLGGLQNVNNLSINTYHGYVFIQRVNRLLSL